MHLSERTAHPEALAQLARDPVMARLIERHGPYRWGLHPVFPALVRAVVGQQLSNAVARTMFRRVQQATGLEPERLLALGEEGLRALGLARAKGRALEELARAQLEGYFAGLHTLSDEEAAARLVRLRGVGPWTAQMVLIFSLGRMDVWPTGDLGMVRQAERLYGLASRAEVEALGERFRPWRSAAAHYLWAETDA
ncbi:DNA-3-methyladenine glycosylase family protein [Oceanithermus desulfurans]|uniref:DNA-3-methyladenine glycosylase II n=2 Tax=Oceanithermus desulfurans TaxID=227924 RepID=A0A511RLZ7_9DEIN|nr:DNA-3-methyladenine glycosylase [Oceanithermus desulfurans]MBB6030482.1 DNA-3-methyladenine glycosylase II [Oceanithermus desulfurans]GEM90107.1 DNA-3-methyladenine glycosidase [Oceanithermus desulfurans NBRC 100063]